MSLRVLLLGDIVGKPGREILTEKLAGLRESRNIAFCIANAENASGGWGLTRENAAEVFNAGADVITLGDHVWKRKEIAGLMQSDSRILRPQNYSPLASGTGVGIYNLPTGEKIAVMNFLGRVFMKPADCPFRGADQALRQVAPHTRNIFVEIHAEATAEKIALGWHLDGRATCVYGTHTHVATADERVLPEGTAYITDIGMTGPHDGVLGRRKDRVIKATLTQMPFSFDVSKGDVRITGAIVTFDPASGKAEAIERIQISRDETP